MRLRFRLEAAQRHRHAFIEGSPLVFWWIAHVRCLTSQIADPAPVASALEQRRQRRVRCICFVRHHGYFPFSFIKKLPTPKPSARCPMTSQ